MFACINSYRGLECVLRGSDLFLWSPGFDLPSCNGMIEKEKGWVVSFGDEEFETEQPEVAGVFLEKFRFADETSAAEGFLQAEKMIRQSFIELGDGVTSEFHSTHPSHIHWVQQR